MSSLSIRAGALCTGLAIVLWPALAAAQNNPRTGVGLSQHFPGPGFNQAGPLFSSATDPADARNTGTARIDPTGAVGVGVSIGTANPSGVYSALASARWGDEWSSSSGAGLNLTNFHASGTFSPEIGQDLQRMGGKTQSFQNYFELNFIYQLSDLSSGASHGAFVNLLLDGEVRVRGAVNNSGGTWNLADHVTWGTNAAGDTTFDFTVNLGGPPPFPGESGFCSGGCSETMQVTLKLDLDGSPGFAHPVQAANFLNTFSVQLASTDPNAVWTSASGRVLSPVPEPGTLTSTLCGLALLAARRLRRPGGSSSGTVEPAVRRQRVALRQGAVALALGGFTMAALAVPDGNHVGLEGMESLSTYEPVAPAVLGAPFIPALPSMPANQLQYFGLSDARFLTLRAQVALNADVGLDPGLASFFQWQTQVQSSLPGTPAGTLVPLELNLAVGGTLGAGTPGALTGGAGTPVPLNDYYDAVANARVEFKMFNLDTNASSTPDLSFTYSAWLNVNARNTGGRPGDFWISRTETAFWEDRAGHSTSWPGNHETRTVLNQAVSTFETMALAPGGYVLPFEAAVGQRLRIEARLYVMVGGSGSGLPYAAFADMAHTADGELRSSTPGVSFANILPGVAPAVPEPASVLLWMAGLLALAPRFMRRVFAAPARP